MNRVLLSLEIFRLFPSFQKVVLRSDELVWRGRNMSLKSPVQTAPRAVSIFSRPEGLEGLEIFANDELLSGVTHDTDLEMLTIFAPGIIAFLEGKVTDIRHALDRVRLQEYNDRVNSSIADQ